MNREWQGIISEYMELLPVTDNTPIVTLGEGNTPLIFARRLAQEIGFNGRLFLKFEGANPTGSFKDRGMALAVSKAIEDGVEMLACASTGNTAASAAAYGAWTEVPVIVLVPAGKIASGKLMQITAYGAKIVQIKANFDACQDIVRELVAKYPTIGLLNSINPYRLEGQKTAAFEIWDELGKAPDYHFIPVGNGGNITAYWMGYREYKEYIFERFLSQLEFAVPEITSREDAIREMPKRISMSSFLLPKMMGYQAEGAAPIVRGHVVENPETIASAIKIGNPARWEDAVKAVSESGGKFDIVSDKEIDHFHSRIPKLCPQAGCEPASAASVAGLARAIRLEEIDNTADTIVVCTITGSLFKDPERVLGRAERRQKILEPDLQEVQSFLKLK